MVLNLGTRSSSTQFCMKNSDYEVEISAFNLTAESGTVVPVAVQGLDFLEAALLEQGRDSQLGYPIFL